MDRLDYLKRDSFYTGVAEGNISSDRLIAMINVINNELVIEKKGIYSVEKFLIARRLMYWQVYLHKTSIVAEHMLVKVLMRAKELAEKKVELFCTSSLRFFLYNKINKDNFNDIVLGFFSKLDDYDILSAIKEWVNHSDKILSNLCGMIVNRDLLKIEMFDKEVSAKYALEMTMNFMTELNLSEEEAAYFVFRGEISNQAYNENQPIKIVNKRGNLEDIVKASDQLNLQALSKPVIKYFICYPKKM
jgi:HD superfamily phosphohydrolase